MDRTGQSLSLGGVRQARAGSETERSGKEPGEPERRMRPRVLTECAGRLARLIPLIVLLCCAGRARGAVYNLWDKSAQSEFVLDTWDTDSGLPQNRVISIAQTPDGYLWLATFHGLVRFDGLRFTTFDHVKVPELGGSLISTLRVDREGNLWSTTTDLKLCRHRDGLFAAVGPAEGLPETEVKEMTVSPEGQFQFRHGETRFGWNGKRFEPLEAEPEIEPGNLKNVEYESSQLWIKGGGRSRMIGDDFLWRVFTAEAKRREEVIPFATEAPGLVWLDRKTSVRLVGSEGVVRDIPWTDGPTSVSVAARENDGHLWIGTWNRGLWRHDPKSGAMDRFNLIQGLENISIRALFVDADQNIWVGTENDGLIRLKKRLFRNLTVANGLPDDHPMSVTEDGAGNLWMVGSPGVYRLHSQGNGTRSEFIYQVGIARSVCADAAGEVWFSTYDGLLNRYHEGSVVPVPTPKAAEPRQITSLLPRKDGSMWVGCRTGLDLARRDSTESVELPRPTDERGVRSIAEDKEGNLFVGFDRSGLLARRGGVWKSYTTTNGLPDARVWALCADSAGTVWVGTYGQGLLRLKGDALFHFNGADMPLPGSITAIVEDDLGYLWLSSNQGVYRLSLRDMNDYADGKTSSAQIMRYDRSNGLGSTDCAIGLQPSVWKCRDGRVWFATGKGLSVVDPNAITVNTNPIPVVIEEVRLNNLSINPATLPRDARNHPLLTVPPGNQRVEIRYTGLNFSSPHLVRFRHRLESLDTAWNEVGTRREISFQGLRPGNYLFRASACNSDGVWNSEGQALALTVRPVYWQTAWFWGLVSVAVCGSAAGVLQYRAVRRRQIRAMRQRIAQDLHDEVGSNLGSILVLSRMLQSSRKIEGEDREDAQSIQKVAEETARIVRDIAWFTSPSFDSNAGLLDRMETVASETLAGLEVTFQRPAPEPPERVLSLEFRRNVFAIFKECLHNISKHARATRVDIAVRDDGAKWEMTVRDNGVGFDPGVSSMGNGLENFRRRASELDGALEIRSKKGEGSSVHLSIPIR